MKTYQEACDRLKLELTMWCKRQTQNIYADYYLYYLPSTAEHDGGISICENQPANPDVKLAWTQRIRKECTIEQNMNELREVLRSLPILEE